MTWTISVKVELGSLSLDVELYGDDSPVALIGPNGSGKTTLLRTIAGAHRPVTGRMEIGESCIFDSGRAVELPPEDRDVGYVPQGCGLFEHLGVVENVAFGLRRRERRVRRAERRSRAVELLERLGCPHLAGRSAADLSGGERQRVALARALMVEPEILLLDEPLAALDVGARRTLRRYLADYLRSAEIPSITVTHDVRDVLALGAYVFVLDDGRVVQSGPAAEVARDPATLFVEEFFLLRPEPRNGARRSAAAWSNGALPPLGSGCEPD